MNKFFALKPNKTKELLKAAQPVMAIFSAINSLQKKIAEKEKRKNTKKTAPEEIKKLKAELKKKEKELEKNGQKKSYWRWQSYPLPSLSQSKLR